MANQMAQEGMYCSEPPAMEKSTVGKMGLKGVPGLRYGVIPKANQRSRQPQKKQGNNKGIPPETAGNGLQDRHGGVRPRSRQSDDGSESRTSPRHKPGNKSRTAQKRHHQGNGSAAGPPKQKNKNIARSEKIHQQPRASFAVDESQE